MWEYDALEMLQDFSRESLSIRSIRMFLEHFELNMYAPPESLRTALNLALVFGTHDYAFTSDDLIWLNYVGTVALCRGDNHHLFFAEINVDIDDYYVVCAAFVKLMNVVFPSNNQYVFKISDAIAFGCKRNPTTTANDNFCVTQLFAADGLLNCVYFLEEALCSEESILPNIVMQYSPQEKTYMYDEPTLKEASADYIRILQEMNSIYGVDTTQECSRYIESFTRERNHDITYKEVCAILQLVGKISSISSYDILDDAILQEQQSTDTEITQTNSSSDSNTRFDILQQYSEAALLDAELLLQEMLNKETE